MKIYLASRYQDHPLMRECLNGISKSMEDMIADLKQEKEAQEDGR